VELVAQLLAATADAHSPRALVRAVAAVLATRLRVSRVELRAPAPAAIAVRSGDDWHCVDEPSAGSARTIATGLAVVTSQALPAFVADPVFREALSQVVAAATRHLEVIQRVARLSQRAHAENRELRADLDRSRAIVARSTAMRAVATRVELVARHPTTVLLTGESGTGKEVVAREIHRRSTRSPRAMVQVDCGALPESLVESELFGHERGAFTGAERAHAGAFERADRGTLFLDEVGELPPAAQAKLLRVLQERRIRRVGGESEVAVDVRLIAATNRDLRAMVKTGKFREDLLYRLDVFAIRIPPLRERRADLAPLAAALTAELAHKLSLPLPALTRSALARLAAHDWPGNVRELANTLEAAMILGSGKMLVLPDELPRVATDPLRLDASVRAAIEDALRATRGKIYGRGGAAERLGLPPGTLQSKMRKLGIERARFTA
jgi:formate hydrogenlyase transcriptional activator